jgi:hypothetical protein
MADVPRGLGQEEVEDHGKIAADPAVDLLRTTGQAQTDVVQVHEPTGRHDQETDLVHTAPSGPAGHLMEGRPVQGGEIVAVEQIGIEQGDGPGRIVDAGGNGGGSEDGLEVALLHHRFHKELPRGKLPPVGGRHAAVLQVVELTVTPQVGGALQQVFQVVVEGGGRVALQGVAAALQGAVALGRT